MRTLRATHSGRRVSRAIAAAAAACALLAPGACAPPGTPEAEREPAAVLTPLPVDTTISLDAIAGWRWRRTGEADLDGDGAVEKLVLTADVGLDPLGRALWEDGHRWAVVIEDGPARTRLHAAFVPMGQVEVALLAPEDGGARRVLVVEGSPHRMRRFEVEYAGPDSARVRSSSDHQIDRWLPGAASPP